MTGWNLPPGCTDADIERAAGALSSRCEDCDTVWDEAAETVNMALCPYDGDDQACAADQAADQDVDR